jgi:exopolysaccharide biosynthesis polyprenyl glycosylphosphotransferase
MSVDEMAVGRVGVVPDSPIGIQRGPEASETVPATRPVPPSPSRPGWERRLVVVLVAADCLAVLVGVAVVALAGLGGGHGRGALVGTASLVSAAWIAGLALARAYEPRFLGIGAEEYRRVISTGVGLLAAVATVSWMVDTDVARDTVLALTPLVVGLTLAQRYGVRKVLHRRRAEGRYRHRVVVAGPAVAAGSLVRQMHSASYQGMQVVAACVPGGGQHVALHEQQVPVLGDLDSIARVVERVGADTVAVLACPEIDGPALRRLGWALESTEAELLVAPALTDVVGSRIAISQVCGLSLLHVDRPELRGLRRALKGLFDRLVAVIALVALLPVLFAVAVLVWLDDRGPVFFRQSRVGLHGRSFSMWKFRTMGADAEERRAELLAVSTGSGLLFKMRNDPRVTRVGRRLRRYSLDELPQLLNVIRGDMSLVGPRPPLPSEVAQYDDHMRRRLVVKPGLTGLWQVSGRSDLDADEAVQLDLRYVDNWSFTFDLLIMWKTFFAVLRGSGAY